MGTKTHGLSVGMERLGETFLLSMRAHGRLTHTDYEAITPLLDSALRSVKEPKVKVLIDATEFEGWEPRAAWDDFKFGLHHRNEFVKIAIYGPHRWQETAARIGSWFISGEMRHFGTREEALAWLQ